MHKPQSIKRKGITTRTFAASTIARRGSNAQPLEHRLAFFMANFKGSIKKAVRESSHVRESKSDRQWGGGEKHHISKENKRALACLLHLLLLVKRRGSHQDKRPCKHEGFLPSTRWRYPAAIRPGTPTPTTKRRRARWSRRSLNPSRPRARSGSGPASEAATKTANRQEN